MTSRLLGVCIYLIDCILYEVTRLVHAAEHPCPWVKPFENNYSDAASIAQC